MLGEDRFSGGSVRNPVDTSSRQRETGAEHWQCLLLLILTKQVLARAGGTNELIQLAGEEEGRVWS